MKNPTSTSKQNNSQNDKNQDINKYAQMDIDDVYKQFNSSSTGLASKQIPALQQKYGLNQIKKAKQQSRFLEFLKNFTSPMALLLWASGIIAFISGTGELGIAIWLVNIINGCFSYWQEFQAKKATNSLMEMLPTYTQVYRDGKVRQLNATQLVPGDVYQIQAGDSVPADGRIISASSLQVDQSALTGESVPENKMATFHAGKGSYSESDMVYEGTTVSSGTANVIAVATGMNTEFGRIAKLTQGQKTTQSPLEVELGKLTRQLSVIAILLGLAFLLLAIFFVHYPLAKSFIFGLGLVVAFIPEGLLPTVTLSLAKGVQRMAKKNALVKSLNSVETLGETTVIASDKTGTLTQNQMTVDDVWTMDGAYNVTGTGYVNNGQIQLNGKQVDLKQATDLQKLLNIVVLDNDTRVETDTKTKKPKILGTPTEAALIILAEKAGINPADYQKQNPRVKEFTFDSVRKRMSTVNKLSDGSLLVAVKGSLVNMLPQCTTILQNGQVRSITDADKTAIDNANENYAKQGLRSIVEGYQILPAGTDYEKLTQEQAEANLTFVGLAVMSDPPREGINDAIAKCHRAGIKVIMVTGDSGITAKAVAIKIGLNTDKARVISGSELETMSQADLEQALKGEVIFARVAPEQKYKIVSTLQAMGEVVAATGDGVNDAPALKKADIGIAMGLTGTDVAKQAADMILADDNFATIVAAIEEGRAVYSDIQKFLTYILNSNVPEAFPSILFLFSRGLIPLPLTVMQILTIDLGTDMTPALGLGAERPESDVMNQPPRKKDSKLLNRRVAITAFLWYGLIGCVVSTAAYFFVNYQAGWPAHALAASGPVYLKATTMTLAAIVFCQIAEVINCRTIKESVFKVGLFSNHLVWLGIGVEICLLMLLMYVPFLRDLFNTAPIALSDWGMLALIPIPIFLLDELRKWLWRNHDAHKSLPKKENTPSSASATPKS